MITQELVKVNNKTLWQLCLNYSDHRDCEYSIFVISSSEPKRSEIAQLFAYDYSEDIEATSPEAIEFAEHCDIYSVYAMEVK